MPDSMPDSLPDSSLDFSLDDADELRRAVGELVRAVRLAEPTPENQIETLGYLARDGALSIAALARRRRIRHQSMSATVVELETQGLVGRSPDPDDARGVLVALTSAGSEMIAQSRLRRSTRILGAAADGLTPAERTVLAAAAPALDKLTAELLGAAGPQPA